MLHLWLKDVPQWTVIFCQLQLVRVALELLTRGVHMAIMAQGNIKLYSICRSVTNILPLILTTWAFYLQFPPYWMYIIWIVSWSILGGCLSLCFARRNIDISYSTYWETVLKPAIKAISPTLLMLIIAKTNHINSAAELSLVILALGVYAVSAYRFLFTKAERNELKMITYRLISKIHK